MKSVMNPYEVFVATRELLLDPDKWCKYAQGQNESGVNVGPFDPAAKSYCMLGAMAKVQEHTAARSDWTDRDWASNETVGVEALGKSLNPFTTYPAYTIAEWNNRDDVEHRHIIAKLDEMIEKTRPCHERELEVERELEAA